MADAVMFTVIALRFLVPLLIPRFPLPAIVACLVIDAADQTVFQALTDEPLSGYQSYDKALDVHYLAIAYISTMRNWRDAAAFDVARFLFLYRLVGVTLFELFDERWILLVFPNTFEYFFIVHELIRTRWDPARLAARHVVAIAAVIWVAVKLPQEWWIHVAQLDFTEFAADHPGVWAVIAVAVGTAVVALVVGWSHLPPMSWHFSVDVDAHLPRFAYTPVRERFFSAVLVEKVVLLALITVIFAQVLPDVRSSDVGIAIGVTVLVVLNAAVSQALRRRGRSWSSSARQFVAMLVVNIAIVSADSVFGSSRGTNLPAVTTTFDMVLLSLLIALFDRFRATRGRMDEVSGLLITMRAERAERAERVERARSRRARGGRVGRVSL